MSGLAEKLAKFEAHLAEQGLRLTAQRRAIAEVFFGSEQHHSLLELLALAQERRGGVGYATVYRTMRLLADAGFATEHRFGENQTRYEPREEGEHHDHFICVTCGAIVEFENDEIEAIQARLARERGFEVVSHKHEIYVRCVGTCGSPQVDPTGA
jgi:Fur family ferric uptake transcriptional regulator